MSFLLATSLVSCTPEPEFVLTTDSEAARSRFLDGLNHFDHLRMTATREAFEASLAEDPRFALASAYLAIAMNYTGDVETRRRDAMEHASSSSESEQIAVEALRAWSQSDYAEAKDRTSALLARAPYYVQAHYELAWFDYKLRDFEAAVASATRAAELDADFLPAYLLRARAELARERLDEAMVSLEQALALDTSDPQAHTLKGDVLKRMGAQPEAIVSYDAALGLAPDFVPAIYGRADALRIAAEYDEAFAAYRELCDATKKLADGSYKELFLDWTKAEDVCFDYGMTYLLAGELDEAARIFEATAHYTAETRMENAPIFYNALGRFFLETGRLDEAEDVYARSLAVSRDAGVSPRMQQLWEGRYLLAGGRIAAKRGLFGEAHDSASKMKAMIDAAGEDGVSFLPAYHYMMGYILLEEERFDEALEHLEQSRLADPFNQWLVARAAAGVGDVERARALDVQLQETPPGSYGHALVVADVRRWLREDGLGEGESVS